MRKLIPAIAAAFAALALTLGPAVASASIVGDPGVYLSGTPSLTLAAPNKIVSGKAAVLKSCLGDGNCAASDNLKASEQFDLVTAIAPSTWTGTELRLHGTQWCVTNRGTSVSFETCHAYASQRWTSSGSPLTGVLTNVKTGLHLTHTAVAAYAPVQVSSQHTFWGNSS